MKTKQMFDKEGEQMTKARSTMTKRFDIYIPLLRFRVRNEES
jgi:hypothetical protein